MTAETIVVGVFVIVAVAGAVLAVRSQQILHNIIGLGISLFGIAGLFHPRYHASPR